MDLITPFSLEAFSRWGPIVWLKTSSWAYPSLEIVHIVGIALVFGTLWVVDLAIWGKLRFLEVNLLARHILPWTLAGFFLAALSGVTMFATSVGDLMANAAFLLKMGLLSLAGINAAVLHARGAINTASRLTRWQAGLSLVVWLAVIASGRGIAYF